MKKEPLSSRISRRASSDSTLTTSTGTMACYHRPGRTQATITLTWMQQCVPATPTCSEYAFGFVPAPVALQAHIHVLIMLVLIWQCSTGLKCPDVMQGDNDPVDVVEIGSQTGVMGAVYKVTSCFMNGSSSTAAYLTAESARSPKHFKQQTF